MEFIKYFFYNWNEKFIFNSVDIKGLAVDAETPTVIIFADQ